MTAYFSECSSTAGRITLVSDGTALTALAVEGQRFMPSLEGAVCRPFLPVFQCAEAWLAQYWAGRRPVFDGLLLKPSGTEFQKRVWRMLLDIPYGQCVSYGQLARRYSAEFGERMAAQAIGGAVGRNPILMIIPCHRVIGCHGELVGFGGGLELKRRLLEHEGSIASLVR